MMIRWTLWIACLIGAIALAMPAALAGERRRPPGKGGARPAAKGGARPAAKGGARPAAKGGGRPGGAANARRPANRPPAKGAPRANQGGGEEGEEEEEPPGAFVLPDSDAVVLRDGTRVDGTIVCAGQAAVTILTPEGEKTFPREKIERTIKRTDARSPRKFMAEELDGHKYLIDLEGGLAPAPEPEPPKGPDIVPLPQQPAAAPAAAPAAPAGPAAAPARPRPRARAGPAAAVVAKPAPKPGPAPPARPKPRAKPAPAATAVAKPAPKAGPAAPTRAPRTPKALPAAPPRPAAPAAPAAKLPKITFPKDPAKLQALLQKLRRDGTLAQYLKDPKVLKAFREALQQK